MATPGVVGPSNASTTVVPSCAAVSTAYNVGDVVLVGNGSGTSYSWEGTVLASLACTKRTRVSVSATVTSQKLIVGGPLTLYAVANLVGTNTQYSSSSNSCDAQCFILPYDGNVSYTLSTVFAFDVPDGTTLLDICVTVGYSSTGTGIISVSSLSVDALTGLGVPASAKVAVPHTWNVALANVTSVGPASGTYSVIAAMGSNGKVSGTPVKDVGCNVYWQLGASPAASDPVVASAVANAGSDGKTFTYNMSAANASPFIAPWLSNSYYATLSSPNVVPITSATVAPAAPTFATFDTVPVRAPDGTANISFLTTAAVTGVVSIYFTIYELLPTGILAANPTGGATYFMNGANSRVTWLVPPAVGCAYSRTATYVVLVTRRDTGDTAAALPFTLP